MLEFTVNRHEAPGRGELEPSGNTAPADQGSQCLPIHPAQPCPLLSLTFQCSSLSVTSDFGTKQLDVTKVIRRTDLIAAGISLVNRLNEEEASNATALDSHS